MDKYQKIKEQLHYFNIQSGIDSVYGNWVVTMDGDVINYLYPYAIFTIHLYDYDWIEKLRRKVWFKSECEINLNSAIERAKQITNS